MHKLIFGIFAHPDDEAFGPSGTLLSEVRGGAELHLMTLTAGEKGANPDNLPRLSEVRLAEWRKAGALIGAHTMHHLGHTDGELDNVSMLRASEQIEQIVRDTLASYASPVEIEFMSMDTNGITGHIDHIVASRAAHLVFYKLKEAGLPLTRLRLVCIPREDTGDTPHTGFVFMEPGRLPEEINETVDNRDHLDEVLAIMRCPCTQRNDCEAHIDRLGERVAIDHFIVKE